MVYIRNRIRPINGGRSCERAGRICGIGELGRHDTANDRSSAEEKAPEPFGVHVSELPCSNSQLQKESLAWSGASSPGTRRALVRVRMDFLCDLESRQRRSSTGSRVLLYVSHKDASAAQV